MMRSGKYNCILLLLLAVDAFPQTPGNSEMSFSGYAGVATGLVYRGVNLADETLVPNLDIAIEHPTGFYLHTWFTRVNLPVPEYPPSEDTSWQGLINAGYNWRPATKWTLAVSHSWYQFAENEARKSPDYREWAISVDYSALLILDYAHTADVWGLDTEQDIVSISARWPLNRRVLGGATLGRVEQDGHYEADYTFAHFNLGLLIQDWSFQLQYHDAFDVEGNYLDDAIGHKWIAQVNWHW